MGGANGTPQSQSDAEATVKRWLAQGSLSLVTIDEEIPTGEKPQESWIFHVDVKSAIGDNMMWAIVDRASGAAHVSSFN